jgi:hypothetical protein
MADLDLTERRLEIARFQEANPGVDLSSLRPRVFPRYTYLPGRGWL